MFFLPERECFEAIETVDELNDSPLIGSFSTTFGVELTADGATDFLAYEKENGRKKRISA